ncbi:MAG: hypothetical protein QM630_04390 [Microbacterium sp.]
MGRTAQDLLEKMADRLARICAVLGGLLDVEKIIFAGAVSPSMGPLLDLTADRLPRFTNAEPPELLASALGADIVAQGAVTRSTEHVRRQALDIDLRP